MNLISHKGVSTLMADSLSQPDIKRERTSLAKSLAPEDVHVGDYVAVLHETYDFPSFFWCEDPALEDRSKTVIIRVVPREGNGQPLRVKAICLPFVLVKHPRKGTFSIDVRCQQLARLDPTYAGTVWKAMKTRKKKKKRRGKKKSK